MSNYRRTLSAVACALSLLASVANADTILQDTGSRVLQVNAYEPFGQSFVAQDPFVRFAFHFAVIAMSSPLPANEPLQIQLRSGDGLGGNVLTTAIFSLPNFHHGFFDVDFSTVGLSVGQSYTALLSTPGTSPYWGVTLFDPTSVFGGGDAYAGGRAYFSNPPGFVNTPLQDMRFRVSPVPEISTGGYLALGLLASVPLLRRRKGSGRG